MFTKPLTACLLAGALLTAALSAQAFGSPGLMLTETAMHGFVHHEHRSRVGQDHPAPAAFPAAGSFAQCASLFPGDQPLDVAKVNKEWRPIALCAGRYAVVYSATSKTPLVVVERLTREQVTASADEARTNEFYADPRLPLGARAELSDYAESGYDRGHMAPAGDMPDPAAMAQSFALSNMVPQDPHNNRKVWSKVESDTRRYVRRAPGAVFVFTGPLFEGDLRTTIGRDRVWVPTSLFKLVYDSASGRAWAYVLANTAESRVGPPMDYESFVRRTHWALLDGVLPTSTLAKR